jgi:hypothetical protein
MTNQVQMPVARRGKTGNSRYNGDCQRFIEILEMQWRYVRETGDTWRLVETDRDTVEINWRCIRDTRD